LGLARHLASQLRDLVLLVEQQAVLAWRIQQREVCLIEATVLLLLADLSSFRRDDFVSSDANYLVVAFHLQTIGSLHWRFGFYFSRELFLPTLPPQLYKFLLVDELG